MRKRIREFALNMGVDDMGVAAVRDYKSPRSPDLETIFPGAKSLIVLAYKELPNCESKNPQIAMAGRLDVMEFVRSCNYRVARFVDRELKAKAMSVPLSYPLHMSYETKGVVGDVSLRHAAVAAGLGNLGRHNLVIHPKMGTRVVFSAVITDLDLPSDGPAPENLCTKCDICGRVNPMASGAASASGPSLRTALLKNERTL
jgi:epoxyqueuosine reductase QueG